MPSRSCPILSIRPCRRGAAAPSCLLVNGAVAAIGGALTALLGVFALKPAAAASRDRWIRAGALSDLEPSVPSVRVLVVPRVDGWYAGARRQTVFLVWDGKKAGARASRRPAPTSAARSTGTRRTASSAAPATAACTTPPARCSKARRRGPLDSLEARIDSARRHGAGAAVIGASHRLAARRAPGSATIREVLFDEPLPPGTGWFFTLGSVLLALIGVQVLTGAFLTLYYAPTPDHAYDSVRFISSTTAGRLVRGLHHFGASFIVVAAALHMLRVIGFGSYKPPRELTWLSGLGAARADPRVRADRLPAALGSARLLGDGRHDQHLEAGAGRW